MPLSIWVDRPTFPSDLFLHHTLCRSPSDFSSATTSSGSFHFPLETELGALLTQHLLNLAVMAHLPICLPSVWWRGCYPPSDLPQARSLVQNPKKCFICVIVKQIWRLCFYSFKCAYMMHFMEDIFSTTKVNNHGNTPRYLFQNLIHSVNF